MRNIVSDTLLVGVDFTNGPDADVLIVGRKKEGEAIDIVNSFQGQEARDLYAKLITKKKKTLQ